MPNDTLTVKEYYFDRANLLQALLLVKPLTGSSIKPIYNHVRFTVLTDDTGENADVYIYGSDMANFICVKYGSIKAENFTYEPKSEIHFLLDIEKLVKILKNSALQTVMIKQIEDEVWAKDEKGEDQIERNAKFVIKTEGRNTLQTLPVAMFPNEDLEGELLASYHHGLLPEIWKKASIARGELEIAKTSMHYDDGNFITLDNSFACAAMTNIRFANKANYSVNLQSGISDVIEKMLGKIDVFVRGGAIIFSDTETGIYVLTRLVTAKKIPIERALNKADYTGTLLVSRAAFSDAINRANSFIDKKYSNAVHVNIFQNGIFWVMKISTPEDMKGQSFEEEITLVECSGPLSATYSVINFAKSMGAVTAENVRINWREKKIIDSADNTMCVVEDHVDYQINVIIPSMNAARK